MCLFVHPSLLPPELSENSSFDKHQLASAVASKCFYHMEEYNDALRHALSAGEYFDTSVKSQYVDKMLSCCIDRYIKQRRVEDSKNKAEDPGGNGGGATPAEDDEDEDDFGAEFETQLAAIVENMFKRCFADGSFEQALGTWGVGGGAVWWSLGEWATWWWLTRLVVLVFWLPLWCLCSCWFLFVLVQALPSKPNAWTWCANPSNRAAAASTTC